MTTEISHINTRMLTRSPLKAKIVKVRIVKVIDELGAVVKLEMKNECGREIINIRDTLVDLGYAQLTRGGHIQHIAN
ncbi:hypothetical protein ALC62_00828 [Cyphomyrmex costatus]|uniref:Uncharacterized protein n=1 Tax=Cyphomyrmex costatus TaxID=456900 RepID=A0A151IPZ1_9HYME|nr:hypothetical protein ALC62_00828 [Cyphomyrmex costatus]